MNAKILISLLWLGMAPAAQAQSLKEQAATEGLSKAVVDKLSAEQLADVLKAREHHDEPALASLNWVAILVPLGLFVMILGLVAVSYSAGHRRERLRHETVKAFLEKGQPVPPQLLSAPIHSSDLRRGVILLACGIGTALTFLALPGGKDGAGLGVLPALIGVGYLVAWRLRPKSSTPERSALPVAD